MIDSVPERIRQQSKDHGLCNFPISSGVSIYACSAIDDPPCGNEPFRNNFALVLVPCSQKIFQQIFIA